MSDMIRCPACRGARKVPKLGGMIGDCNSCKGTGNIAECDKPVKVIEESLPLATDIIKATSEAVPASEDKFVVEVLDAPKIDPKQAVFKRKKA